MNYKKNIVLIVLFVFATSSLKIYAQTSKEIKLEKRKVRKARKDSLQKLPIYNYLSLDLTTLIPTDFPRINIGYIQKINDRIALGGDIGIGLEGHASKENYSLWEIRPQLIYTIKRRKRFHHFLLLETFYIYNKETRFNSSFEPENNQGGTVEQIDYERADYTRVKYGATLNYGEYINFSKRLGLRTTIGGGIRYKENNYKNLLNPVFSDFSDRGFIIQSPFRKEGFLIGFEFNLNLKLIYKLY